MKRRLGAWLALAAIALNALWPLVALAQPQTFPSDICSTVGAKAPAGYGPASDIPAQSSHHDKLSACCFYCVSTAHGASLIPAQLSLAVDSAPLILKFSSPDRLQWNSTAYLPALSRGPPLLS